MKLLTASLRIGTANLPMTRSSFPKLFHPDDLGVY
jgi:hypothetical protein